MGKTISRIFDDHKKSRIIIATFASNVDRVQQIINAAYEHGRKVIVEGRSMVNIITIASELGYIKIPDNTLIDIDTMRNYPDDKLVLITTGSQGETMAALSRMAANTHRKVSIKPGVPLYSVPTRFRAMRRRLRMLSMNFTVRVQRLFSRIHMFPVMPARKRSS